jgi:hypothetical protein
MSASDENNESCGESSEQTYDLVIPPGVPRGIIEDITSRYEVTVVDRLTKLDFANMDGIERNLLAFRGKKETMLEVEQELRRLVKAYIGE